MVKRALLARSSVRWALDYEHPPHLFVVKGELPDARKTGRERQSSAARRPQSVTVSMTSVNLNGLQSVNQAVDQQQCRCHPVVSSDRPRMNPVGIGIPSLLAFPYEADGSPSMIALEDRQIPWSGQQYDVFHGVIRE